jgi:hypothetical protein
MRMKLGAGLLLVAAMAGCAAGGGSKGGAPIASDGVGESLEERVVARWSLLIGKQAELAWELLTPGYRDTHPRDLYARGMNNRPVTWKAAKYLSQDCVSERVCDVMVEVSYLVPISQGQMRPTEQAGQQTLREKWMRFDGAWYHMPKDGY